MINKFKYEFGFLPLFILFALIAPLVFNINTTSGNIIYSTVLVVILFSYIGLRFKDWVLNNIIDTVFYGLLFNVIFILPGFFKDNETLLSIDRFVLIIMTLAFIVYKLFGKVKDSKSQRLSENKTLIDLSGSVISIVIGLLFGLVIMLIFNPAQAFEGFWIILQGGFNEGFRSMGNTIYFAVPIILTGLSVAFAFRTGLFNIGASGQFTMGAFVAIFIGVKWGFIADINPLLHWFVAVLFAVIVGGIWGAIPGYLKAFNNVNEVVSSIMLNYIAMYINVLMIKKYIYNTAYNRTYDILSSAETPGLNLQHLFPNSSINGGIVVAILTVYLLHVILNKTTFGFELKAVGLNKSAAKYAGMNSKVNIVKSMAIAGGVAGLAGALTYLVAGKFLIPETVILSQGFTGIAISLLGLSSPIGVLFAGLFFGYLQQGGYYLQLLDFKPEIIDIIIAVIIYLSALSLFIQKFVIKGLKRRDDKTQQSEVIEGSDV